MLHVVVWTSLALPFVIFYLYSAGSALIRRYRSQRWKRLRSVQNGLLAKWIGLCHKNDEALQGLRSLRNVKINVFPEGFAGTALTYLSAFVIPISVLTIASSESLTLGIFSLFPVDQTAASPGIIESGKLVGGGRDFVVNLKLLSAGLLYTLWYPMNYFGVHTAVASYLSLDTQTVSSVILVLIMLVIFPLALFACSWLLIRVIPLLSRPISKILNHMTWQQIKKSMLGDDVAGENAVDAQSFPLWADKPFAFIPDALGNEVSEASDLAAARSLAKFRGAFDAEAFRGHPGGLKAFAEHLSWEELIHTCYFQVPRFRKLVAYAISTAGGFRPTEQFRRDADYALVERWLQVIWNATQEDPAHKKFPEPVMAELPKGTQLVSERAV